jgi:hypothetical protein
MRESYKYLIEGKKGKKQDGVGEQQATVWLDHMVD